MDERARHDRTVVLLSGRLEGLARAAERLPRGSRRYERELAEAAAATRHAVALELISPDEADAIWATRAWRRPDPARRRATAA